MDDNMLKDGKADEVVGSLHKDFVIVGKHRVHGWYAWAIVGIVFGMALGIIYVANRSNQFTASQAAQVSQPAGTLKVQYTGNFVPGMQIAGIRSSATNADIWIAGSASPLTAQDQIVWLPTQTTAGFAASNFFSAGGRAGVIVVAPNGDAYRANASGNTVTVNLAAPFANFKKTVKVKYDGYINPASGPTRPAPLLSGNVYLAMDYADCTGCSALNSGRLAQIDPATGTVIIPQGMMAYATNLTFDIGNNRTRSLRQSMIKLPGQSNNVTYKLVFTADSYDPNHYVTLQSKKVNEVEVVDEVPAQ